MKRIYFYFLLTGLALISFEAFSQKDVQFVNKGLKAAQNGNIDKALVFFDKSLALNPDNIDANFYKGQILEQNKAYPEAIGFYSKAIKLLDSKEQFYIRRGYCYYKIDSLNQSLKDLNFVLDRTPKNIEALKKRVDVYRKMENWEKLLADFDTYLEMNPQDYYAKLNRANVLNELGRYNENYEVLVVLAKEYPNEHIIQNNYAESLKNLELFEDALKQIDSTIKLKPDYDNAYITKAEILLKLERFEEACENKSRAIELGFDINKLDSDVLKEFEKNCK
ncbi:tetratricopeptide repeat protein [Carboxylicivirga caseinilyticus]|uniref:tetratricopeptide repeat protein n=1 Tax=Carboxylicivirga caseinilyticus TaxID=3417572 RepID=UPI003D33C5AB|nr:tetratricopeptide repeat protein [Marinilabiliaceae bacterium A049]